ncbi:MAG: hypothetical protein J0M24_25200 [Verrucomicrobia bacterium]|nr:hypothetical protein [Verrucomicrobiota bacterium]
MRFLFYSHDGFGLGHTCRNLAIARALTQLAPQASVLVASGSDDVTRLGVPDRVEILKLPGLRKLANESYGSRYLGVSSDTVRQLRSRLLQSTVESFQPDVLLVDKHPFGAGGELRPALGSLRALGHRAVLGLRDILDDPATVRQEWEPHDLPHAIPEHYDAVLVYGHQSLFDTASEYGFPASLLERTHYCGYVVDAPSRQSPRPAATRPSGKPLVLATVGGGEDGAELLEAFLTRSVNEPWERVAVTGPLVSAKESRRLKDLADLHGIELHTFIPGLQKWFATADVVVCMGGYNTIAQCLAAGARVICVPRTHPRREQWVRAESLAQRGLLRVLPPEQLTPARLNEEIRQTLASSRSALRSRIRAQADFTGAATAARHLMDLADAPRSRPVTPLFQTVP